MLRSLVSCLLASLLLLVFAPVLMAQPQIIENFVDKATGGRSIRLNDLEGGIWEYKVLERKGDHDTVLQGKLRIKDRAAFDVPDTAEGHLMEIRKGEPGDQGGTFPGGIRPPTKRNLGIADRIAEGNRGGERVGDLTYSGARTSTRNTIKVRFHFDKDDDHILSGEAFVKYVDDKDEGGRWRGTYTEETPEGKKEKWNFEMRYIEG